MFILKVVMGAVLFSGVHGLMVAKPSYVAPLSVTTSNQMQPFSTVEESVEAADLVQSTRSPLVTVNGEYLQLTQQNLQGSAVDLRF